MNVWCKQSGTDCTAILVFSVLPETLPKNKQKKPHHHSNWNQPLISCLSDSTWALGAAFLLRNLKLDFCKNTQMRIGSSSQTAPATIEFVYQMSQEHQGSWNRHANSAEWDVHLNMPTLVSHGLQFVFFYFLDWTPWIQKTVTGMHHSELCNRHTLQALNTRYELGGWKPDGTIFAFRHEADGWRRADVCLCSHVEHTAGTAYCHVVEYWAVLNF